MAKSARPPFRTRLDELRPNSKPSVPQVVQGGELPQPWKDLLETLASVKNPKTRAEILVGRITLLKNQLEEKNESMGHILNDDAFSRSLANCTEAAEAFRLQEFMLLNEKLIDAQRKWNIPDLRVACAKVSDFIVRTKAITPSGTVEFDDPVHNYPSEGLMTKLIMIAPENTK